MSIQLHDDRKMHVDGVKAPWARGISTISTCAGDDFSRFVTVDTNEMQNLDENEAQVQKMCENDESLIGFHLRMVDAVALNLNPSLSNYENGPEAQTEEKITINRSQAQTPPVDAPSGFLDVTCAAFNPALSLFDGRQGENCNDEQDESSLIYAYPGYIDAGVEFVNPSLSSSIEARVHHSDEKELLETYAECVVAVSLMVNPSLANYDIAVETKTNEGSVLQSYSNSIEEAVAFCNPSMTCSGGQVEELAEQETPPKWHMFSFEKLMVAINPLLDPVDVLPEQRDVPLDLEATTESDISYMARVESCSPVALTLSLLRSSLKFLGGGALFFEALDQQPTKHVDETCLIKSDVQAVYAMALRIDSALDCFREEHRN